jgi:hypothetical protein
MTLRNRWLLGLALALLIPFAPLPAQEAEEEEEGRERQAHTEGTVEVGGWAADESGSPDLASEYEPTDGGPLLRLGIESFQDWGSLSVEVFAQDEDDLDLQLDFDVRRMVRSHTTYTELIRRLVHNPLEHIEAATRHGRAVYHTDTDPGREYGLTWSDLDHRTEVQLPAFPGLTFDFGARNQQRDGVRQSLTVSHCSTCHVVSQSRPIDQRTTDATLGAEYAWKGGRSLRASFTRREFVEKVRSISLLFDDALQPELRTPIFDDRLQWDSAQGPQPIDGIPDIDKSTARLDLRLPDAGGFLVTAGGVWSATENQTTGLSSEFQGLSLATARPFLGAWNVRLRARAYRLENDSVFVDTAEPPSIAGPQAGRTYRQIYGFDPDFQRRSALNRDVIESRLDVGRKLGGRKGTLRFLWDFTNVDREYLEVTDDGGTETTRNVFGIAWNARPLKGWKLDASYKHGEADNPFLAVNDKYSTLVSSPSASPLAPAAAQYYQFQDARIADGTAYPASWDEVRLAASRTFGNNLLSATARWWDGGNDEGDLIDWSRAQQALTVSFWSAPATRWEWFASAAYNDSELDAAATIPIFDG